MERSVAFSDSLWKQTGTEGLVHAWFAGFAPYDDPEIAVVVFIDNGGHGWYTGETVRTIMEQYFGMNTTQVQEDMTQTPYVETYR